MKYSFNFLQVANWVYVIRNNLKKFRERLDTEKVSKEEAVKLLEAQKKQLKLIKDILLKRSSLIGIQKNFLKNLEQIKEEFGIKK